MKDTRWLQTYKKLVKRKTEIRLEMKVLNKGLKDLNKVLLDGEVWGELK
jgi:hypothetical protein